MTRCWCVILLLLGGCASAPIITAPKTVSAPVSVPCLKDVPAEPAFKTDAEILSGTDAEAIVNLRVDRLERQKYEDKLRTSMSGCE